MRRALVVTLVILFCLPIVNAEEISVDQNEDSSGTLSGQYIVKDGDIMHFRFNV